jgi:hypothetical protein
MHDFVLVAHSNMYMTLTHLMGGLCMCVCIQVFDKCTTPEQMREARREIMKFGPGVLSMVDRILWATAEVGRKVGSHSAAVRKVMIQDVDRGQGSHKDEITFRNENFSLHTAKLYKTTYRSAKEPSRRNYGLPRGARMVKDWCLNLPSRPNPRVPRRPV